MQQFLLLAACVLGLIVSDFGPSSTVVLGKTAALLGTRLKREGAGAVILSPNPPLLEGKPTKKPHGVPPPPPPPLPQSLAQVQNDASYSMSMQDICASFTNGTQSEFYSPLYPSNYLNNTDCYKIISAGPGQVIRIKFLDHFHIEYEENCNYDFLEIRDGRYGYSTLIENKRICGTSPPSVVQSSGRHLWLRFHSDSDIQYIGFKAVYEFRSSSAFKPDLDECSMTSTNLEDTIGTANISQEIVNNARAYEVPVDCTWMIQAADHERIYLTFEQYELEKPNDCTYNFIEIYGPQTELTRDSREKQYCGSRAEPYSSGQNVLYIRFFSMFEKKGSRELKSKFQAYYNFYRDSSPGAPCQDGAEVDCNDNTCIDRSLRCNRKNNCKLSIDEENCPDPSKGKEKHYDIIVIASLGCVLIAGMCGGLFLNIYRKLRQDRKDLLELKEALRKSRESQLAMQQVGCGIPSMGTSPQVSSQDSGDSKQTVLERPFQQQQQQQPPTNNNSHHSNSNSHNGDGGESGYSDTGAFALAQSRPQSIQQPAPVKPIRPTNYGAEAAAVATAGSKQIRVQAEVASSSSSVPSYNPPPPYVSATISPRVSSARSRTISDNNMTKKHVIPPPPGAEEQLEPGEVVIEVRDSACQTRDSFLAQLRQLSSSSPSSSSSASAASSRKAPLARGEALDMCDTSMSMPSKRITRASRTPDSDVTTRSVTSATSSMMGTDRIKASLGSLQDIDEYQE